MQPTRTAKSKDITLPSPIMGLNRKDSLAAMNPLFAVRMDNYIPMDNYVELRSGYSLYYQTNKPVKTMAMYNYPSHKKFFGIWNGKIYDITSAADVTDMEVTLTNDYCQTVQYKNYLYFMNGADTPQAFYVDSNDDEHIGNWGFSGTGLNDKKIIAASVSHEFIWFVEKKAL